MGIANILKKAFIKKEPIVYTPQREYIDRRHDGLMRQLDYYRKKAEIPKMEEKIKRMEKQTFGNSLQSDDKHNILKVPYHFKWKR